MSDGRAFHAVVGHRRQVAVLAQAMVHDAVAPAWLFHGPAGVGKMTTAREFARALLCGAPGEGPCGSCPSCRAVQGETHPDMALLVPDAKTPKARKTLRIEHVRRLQEFLSLRPGMGGRRVCLLDGVEALTLEAANALLKTLEDPPPESVIVLVTSLPGRLPPTVHSRCRSIGFAGLAEEDVRAVLLKLDWPAGDAVAGAQAADGCPGAVHALKGESWKEAGRAARALGEAVDGGGEKIFGAVEGFKGGREEAALALHLLLVSTGREMRRRVGAGSGDRKAEPALAGLTEEALAGQLENLIAASRMLEGNVNVKLALGALCRRWAEGIVQGEIRPLQREW